MPEKPLISVLMPVYNARRYLAAAVDSVLAQTLGDFEFIIIDDGSTDASKAMLEEYAARDKRIRLISRPNTGYVRALNEGLGLARGELIARMDADDICVSDRFERQVAFLDANPDVVLLGGAVELIDAYDRLLLRPPTTTTNDEIQSALLEGRSEIGHPTAMFRREAAVSIGGYDESMRPAEDLDMWLRLSEIGKVANLPDTVLRYRIHPKSESSMHIERQVKNAYLATERAWTRRGMVGSQFSLSNRTRPSSDRKSKYAFAMQYGWWAFNSGERLGAMHYALQALTQLPFKTDAWRLFACAAIKSAS